MFCFDSINSQHVHSFGPTRKTSRDQSRELSTKLFEMNARDQQQRTNTSVANRSPPMPISQPMIRVEHDNETGDDVSNNHRLHSVLAAVITQPPDDAAEMNSPGTALLASAHSSGNNFDAPATTCYLDASRQLQQ